MPEWAIRSTWSVSHYNKETVFKTPSRKTLRKGYRCLIEAVTEGTRAAPGHRSIQEVRRWWKRLGD